MGPCPNPAKGRRPFRIPSQQHYILFHCHWLVQAYRTPSWGQKPIPGAVAVCQNLWLQCAPLQCSHRFLRCTSAQNGVYSQAQLGFGPTWRVQSCIDVPEKNIKAYHAKLRILKAFNGLKRGFWPQPKCVPSARNVNRAAVRAWGGAPRSCALHYAATSPPHGWPLRPRRRGRAQRQHGGLVGEDQLLDLHAREHVDEVERLVPYIQVRSLAQAAGDEHLFSFARRKNPVYPFSN